MKFSALLLVLMCLLGLTSMCAAGPTFKQTLKLEANDRATNDEFGESVAISGDTMVVGAHSNDAIATNSGAVYVYNRTQASNGWGLGKKLVPSDAALHDRFGDAVTIDGDTIIVGAPYVNGNGIDPSRLDEGAVYVFERNQGGADNWGEVIKILPESAKNLFGNSVSLSGDTLVVGTRFRQAAFIYERNQGGGNSWGISKTLTLPAPILSINNLFGETVSVSGNTVVVGQAFTEEGSDGAAYVYGRDNGGAQNWGLVKKLEPSGDHPLNAIGFGSSIAIDGSTIAVGAPFEFPTEIRPSGYRIGLAYIFERDNGGVDNWGEAIKLKPVDRAYDDDDPHTDDDLLFGSSVAISGNLVAVGAPNDDQVNFDSGSTYVFARNINGQADWRRIKIILAGDRDGSDHFGDAVALFGETVIVGAKDVHAPGSSDSGAAYVYSYQDEQSSICFVVKSAKNNNKFPICL